MDEKILRNYARLIARVGANIKKDQEAFITAELDQPEFITMVTEELYKAGASKVVVNWSHQPVTKLEYDNCSLERLSTVDQYVREKWQYERDYLPAQIYILSEDPDGLNGIDQNKLSKALQERMKIKKPIRNQMENKYQWCIAGAPGKKWAQKVFPDKTGDDAQEALWRAILYTSRALEGDPIGNWKKHNDDLSRKFNYLNSLGITALEYKSSNGTDLKVGMMPDGVFAGGSEKTIFGDSFNPNIPSEEIFTSPMRGSAEGIVYSTKPLSYRGQLIEDFSITFRDGKAVAHTARVGDDLLEEMIHMDEGSQYLGECALVPYDSPINNSGILFYNTLYDENASCHLALGRGFPDCIKGYEKLSYEQCKEKGMNDSISHTDFMIGSKDLSIIGDTEDGKKVPIFHNGNWAF